MTSALSEFGLAAGCVGCGTLQSIHPMFATHGTDGSGHSRMEIRRRDGGRRRIGAEQLPFDRRGISSPPGEPVETMSRQSALGSGYRGFERITLCIEPKERTNHDGH